MHRGMTQEELALTVYHDQPIMLLIGNAEPALACARAAAAALGVRICDTASVEEGMDRLDRQIRLDCVWVDLAEAPPAAASRLLDRLAQSARSDLHGSVIVTPWAMIDIVAALPSHPRFQLLCEGTPDDDLEALRLALVSPEARLHDVGRNGQAPRLQQLSEEVGRIANILATLSEDERAVPSGSSDPTGDAPLEAAAIRAMIRARRLRDQFFRTGLFADPAWDMLLDLMAARIEKQQVAVSSLCIAAAVPPTTALRWIKALTEAGLFVRKADPQDGRRIYIELSDDGAKRFEAYLRAAQRIGPLAV